MELWHRIIFLLLDLTRYFREMLIGVPVFSKNLEDRLLKKQLILKDPLAGDK